MRLSDVPHHQAHTQAHAGPSTLPLTLKAPIPLRPKPPTTPRIHKQRTDRVYASQADHIMDKYDDMLSKLPALEAWTPEDEAVRPSLVLIHF
jgi:hypothetical protein